MVCVLNRDESAALSVWMKQSVWSQAATAAKRGVERARAAALFSGIAAAVLATAAAQVMPHDETVGRVLAFLAAVAVALVALAASRSSLAGIQAWISLRSLSEALKSELYAFLAGVGPYRGPAPAATLLDRTDGITGGGADLIGRTTALTPDHRPLPSVVDVESYVTVRMTGQIETYYRPQAALMARRVGAVRRAELGLAVVAAILSAAAGAFGIEALSAWVAVVTTVAAAATAHAAAGRYEYQQMEFSRTAAELEDLLVRRSVAVHERTTASEDEFVRAAEQVISVQNEAWMAKWNVD